MSNRDNARAFRLVLENFAEEEIPQAMVEFHQRVTLSVLRRLILKSPVGNPDLWKLTGYGLLRKGIKKRRVRGYVGGTFRGFWQAYANQDPANGEKPPAKGTRPRTAGAAQTAATRALNGLAPFSVSYIVNGMPYAERLNRGWSTQAPAGFFELAIAEEQNALRSATT